MRLLLIIAALALLSAAGAQLDRGTKGQVEDVILVGADDWHSSVAATPLAIWSEGSGTVVKTLLILPKDVRSGDRLGWVEQKDLDRYGATSVLHTLETGNLSKIIVHGEGDLAKSLVETAHKEGLKVYLTATLEPPVESETEVPRIESIPVRDDAEVTSLVRDMFLDQIGLREPHLSMGKADPERLQRLNPEEDGFGRFLCPVNPEVREDLYNWVERIIEEYKADGIVLYDFGFQDENYCFCDYCKDKFYRDTGIDLTKIRSNSYNLERWRQWKQDQILEMVREVRNITSDLGPVELGVALSNPFDRSQGYNYAELSRSADFMVVSPLSRADIKLASGMTEKPVYVRLSDDYVEYVLSTQNVEGTVRYIEDLASAGARGFAFEYSVVYTPLWYELQPPTNSARWLLGQMGGRSLGLGNVSWPCDSWIKANSSFALAEKISQRWRSSPGAVLVGEDYGSGLTAATLASYLNWPVLFAGRELPRETSSALRRLGAREVLVVGPVSMEARKGLEEMNLTIKEGNRDLLLAEMRERGDNLTSLVFTNSHDLSLLPPIPRTEIKRAKVGKILVDMKVNPSQIPAERAGEIVRLNITLTNIGKEDAKEVQLTDLFPSGRLPRWPKPSRGSVNLTDPYTGDGSDPTNAFADGSLLVWRMDRLEKDRSASLTLEVEILHALDAGWKQRLDSGITVTHSGLVPNVTVEEREEWPITNITYPSQMPVGMAKISWSLARMSSYTALNVYTPEGRAGGLRITDTAPGKTFTASVPLTHPGRWRFNIEAGDGYSHKTGNFTIEVRSDVQALSLTSFSHTKVPRLSLVAPQIAAARKALLVDAAKDPREVDPAKEEEGLRDLVKALKIDPQYLIVVGDPGSLPFISTGLKQNISRLSAYDVYRDYQLRLDDDNYTEVAEGRIIGLSVYDASQLVARTLAYDKVSGGWKKNALVISSPPLQFPQSPISMRIRDYLSQAGLKVKDLRWEEATSQGVISQMNNGQNFVHFDHHGREDAWLLSYWSMMDIILDEAQVKQLTLSPQTTTTGSCVTARLKGFSINVSGTEMYVPMRLDDSIALAFIRAGAVNYIGPSSSSWIFISDDRYKRFYQALVFENATVGEAAVRADQLYRMKLKGVEKMKPLKEFEDLLPDWDTSVPGMLNETVSMNSLLGDPSFRPALPTTPSLPYALRMDRPRVGNRTEVKASITPVSEMATDWLYWIEQDATGGKLQLNAPPALIGEALLPRDAEEVVVREDGREVWHYEEVAGTVKRVLWPVIRPRTDEKRSFAIEYRLIPGLIQVINVTPGWNAVSLYLKPKEPSIFKYLKNKPYRGVFSISGEDWRYSMKDSGLSNVSSFEAGRGYIIDTAEGFTIDVPGKPVEVPFRLRLQKGWNMIGVPFNQSLAVNNITVNAEHKRLRYPEAVEKGILSAFLWSYDGEEWGFLGRNDTLEPGRAYLVEASGECGLEFRR